jgi:prevent-host-death family protein
MQISAVDARRRFGELLSRVLHGNEEVIIQKAGKPVARLVRIDAAGAGLPPPQGRQRFSDARGLGKELWSAAGGTDWLKNERSSWD